MAAVLVMVTPSRAQLPRGVSPRFARAMATPDSTVIAWIIARRSTDLADLGSRITALGAHVRFYSQFVHAVSASVSAGSLRELASLPGVIRVQPVGTYYRRSGGQADGRTDGPQQSRIPTPGDTTYGANAWAMDQLDIPALHQRGLRGAGVRIAMLDAGFNTLHPLMAGATIIAQKDFVYGDSIVRDQPGEAQGEMSHGTATWSLIAARKPGTLFGVAPDAEFLLAKTEFTLTETRVEEDRWVAAVEWAIGLGAQIISSSLGYLSFDGGFTYTPTQLNGDVAVTSVAADSAARRGVLVVVAVGNSGPGIGSMETPADAHLVVAVGATDSLLRIAGFSSRGPTGDGRIKPEVAAPGVAIVTAAKDTGLTRGSGTSFATPLIAGLAALIQSGRAGPAFDLREGLLQASNTSQAPNNTFGYGIPDGLKLFAFPLGVQASGPLAGFLTTVTPKFVWSVPGSPSAASPFTSFVKIGTDSTMHTLLVDTIVGTQFFTARRAFRPGVRLFWRVTVSSAVGVAESMMVQGPVIVPPWVTLVTLAAPQGATIRDSLPRFYWRSPSASAGFVYDVDIYPASRSPALAVATARGITDTTFQPATPLERNLPYRWRVVAHIGSDSEIVTSAGTFLVADASTPATTVLFQNFPNPFPNANVGLATTCIWFDVNQQGDVRLEIFDIRGRLVRRLAPGPGVPSELPPGRYGRPSGDAPGTCDDRFAWDGRDDGGQVVSAGVYIYRLTAPGFRDTKRIVFLGP